MYCVKEKQERFKRAEKKLFILAEMCLHAATTNSNKIACMIRLKTVHRLNLDFEFYTVLHRTIVMQARNNDTRIARRLYHMCHDIQVPRRSVYHLYVDNITFTRKPIRRKLFP